MVPLALIKSGKKTFKPKSTKMKNRKSIILNVDTSETEKESSNSHETSEKVNMNSWGRDVLLPNPTINQMKIERDDQILVMGNIDKIVVQALDQSKFSLYINKIDNL